MLEGLFCTAQFSYTNFFLYLGISVRGRPKSKTTHWDNFICLVHARRGISIVLRNFWLLRSHPSLDWRRLMRVGMLTGVHMLDIFYFDLLQLFGMLLETHSRLKDISITLCKILVWKRLFLFKNTVSCHESLDFFHLSLLLALCSARQFICFLIFYF